MGFKFKKTVLSLGCLMMLASNLENVSNNIQVQASSPSTGGIAYTGSSINYGYDFLNAKAAATEERNYKPSMTFLIHGMAEDASAWSSDTIGVNSEFCYNANSILPHIWGGLHETKTYLTRPSYVGSSFRLELTKCTTTNVNSTTSYTYNPISKIDDFRYNMVFIYESPKNESGLRGLEPLQEQYELFERVVNSLMYDFYLDVGFAPKINLVGHSTGGLIAQQYANTYPKNVDTLITLGTPFKGSVIGDIFKSLCYDYNMDIAREIVDSPVFHDLQDVDYQNSLRDNWNNQPATEKIHSYSYASAMTLPLVNSLIDNLKKYSFRWNDFRFNFSAAAIKAMNECLDYLFSINDDVAPDPDGYYSYYNAVYDHSFYPALDIWPEDAIEAILSVLFPMVAETFKDEKEILFDLAKVALEKLNEEILTWYVPEPYKTIGWLTVKAIGKKITGTPYDYIIGKLAKMFASLNLFEGLMTCDGFFTVDSQLPGYNHVYEKMVIFNEKYLQKINYSEATSVEQLPFALNFITQCSQVVHHIQNELDCEDYVDDERFAKYDLEYSFKTFSVPSDIDVFILEGNPNSSAFARNTHIVINDRTTPLTIKMKDFIAKNGYNNESSEPFIERLGSSFFQLNIIYEGYNNFDYLSSYARPYLEDKPAIDLSNARVNFIGATPNSSLSIYGANGANGANGNSGNNGTSSSKDGKTGMTGKNGSAGCVAVVANAIDVTDASILNLHGGNGGAGGNGGTGGNGANGVSAWKSDGTNGGYGGRGGMGGYGGYGGLPVTCKKIIAPNNQRPTNVHFYPGKCGKGGNGGTGGKGGNGGAGADQITHEDGWWIFKKTVVDQTFRGGNGGNGGNGGPGAISGQNPFYESSIYSKYFSNCALGSNGVGGVGGAGGNGGNAGVGGTRGNNGSSGSRGQNA